MANKINKDGSGLPSELKHQISEHTNGGFLMLYFDGKGKPKMIRQTDTDQDLCALAHVALAWSNAYLHQVTESMGEDSFE